jgi:hypothetical protein
MTETNGFEPYTETVDNHSDNGYNNLSENLSGNVNDNHQKVFDNPDNQSESGNRPDKDGFYTDNDGHVVSDNPCSRAKLAIKLGISKVAAQKLAKKMEKYHLAEDLFSDGKLTTFAQKEIQFYRSMKVEEYEASNPPLEASEKQNNNQGSFSDSGGAIVPNYQSSAQPQSALDKIQNFDQGNQGAITPEVVVERFDQRQQQNFSEGQNALAQLQQMDEYLQNLDKTSFQAEYEAAKTDGWKRRLALEAAKKEGDLIAYQQLYGNVGNNSDNCQGNGNGNS